MAHGSTRKPRSAGATSWFVVRSTRLTLW